MALGEQQTESLSARIPIKECQHNEMRSLPTPRLSIALPTRNHNDVSAPPMRSRTLLIHSHATFTGMPHPVSPCRFWLRNNAKWLLVTMPQLGMLSIGEVAHTSEDLNTNNQRVEQTVAFHMGLLRRGIPREVLRKSPERVYLSRLNAKPQQAVQPQHTPWIREKLQGCLTLRPDYRAPRGDPQAPGSRAPEQNYQNSTSASGGSSRYKSQRRRQLRARKARSN